MKQPGDDFTGDMFAKRGPGRPRKPGAMTAAERAKQYRERKKAREFNFLRGRRDETA